MQKYDSFQPKRSNSIDGFISKPSGNRPRQPVFRASGVNPQQPQATLPNMPIRPITKSTVLDSQTPTRTTPFPGVTEGTARRHRRRASESEPKQKRHIGWKKGFKRAGIILGILVLLIGGWLGFKFYKDLAKLTGNKNPFSLFSVFHPANLKNQNGRVNILVAGNSADDKGHDGAQLTDSIMILSIDTHTHTAFMLSVPRDLWVNIPGYGHAKINAAYPNGGMDKLQSVIETNLGVTIDYQVLVNYSAFRDLVNAVGGITVNIQSADPRGLYDPSIDYTSRTCCALVKLKNGPQTLNGKQALNLARARGDAYGSYGYGMSDFTRTQEQRAMLLAIKDKASNSSVIANPFKVTSIVDAVGNNVVTNLHLNEIETLYSLTKGLNDSNIQSLNINSIGGKQLLTSYTASDGESALSPALGLDNFTDIQNQITKVLSNDPVVRESANVVLLNATNTLGLAKTQEKLLTAKGINVTDIADASTNQATTTIVDNSAGKDPATLAALTKLYAASPVADKKLTALYPNANFIVILGQNVSSQTTTTH